MTTRLTVDIYDATRYTVYPAGASLPRQPMYHTRVALEADVNANAAILTKATVTHWGQAPEVFATKGQAVPVIGNYTIGENILGRGPAKWPLEKALISTLLMQPAA